MSNPHASEAAPFIEWLAYCRPGFEPECGQELQAVATDAGSHGAIKANRGDAYVRLGLVDFAQPAPAARTLMFARQALSVVADLPALDPKDRLTPIAAALARAQTPVSDVWVEAADSEAGAELKAFCRSFEAAALMGLRKRKLITADAAARLHLFFPRGTHCVIAIADPHTAAPWPMGIPRLKFPREAPSRSTLKLEEAFMVLLGESERERWLRPGMTAVDLGAAPGGWTYQLVRRSLRVTAIDNGPMAPELMQSGLVTHLREDGFRHVPRKAVDWLVCDMVEQPSRVAALMGQWLAQGWCRRAIFNLKLPMKKRYAEVHRCLDTIREAVQAEGRNVELRAKQLYHDREEVTVAALPL